LGAYTEDSQEYSELVERLTRKWETAKRYVPDPVIKRARRPAQWGIVSIGSSDPAIVEAVDRLAEEGIHVSYCRIRAFPFGRKVQRFLERHERIFVVEQNRDAQLRSLLTLETDFPKDRMHSILSYGGLPMDCRCVVAAVRTASEQEAAA
jgi:2-oxoglutarate ferredoxin oxidoreductase subunit alpha